MKSQLGNNNKLKVLIQQEKCVAMRWSNNAAIMRNEDWLQMYLATHITCSKQVLQQDIFCS